MARTHGTRSSYNAGCRCDDCREASRLARARQRAVTERRTSSWGDEGAVAFRTSGGSNGRRFAGWLMVGGGLLSLWHGVTLEQSPDVDAEAYRRTRKRWYIAGGVLVAVGGVVVVRVS
jgi:hypothetical protein